MSYKIDCSIGEIVDKYTILTIKLHKSTDINKIKNITYELNSIIECCSLLKKKDNLFDELKQINENLWSYEDDLRFKSSLKEFDDNFIELANNIHKTNDLRYTIKRQINEKYNSNIIEEKIYNTHVQYHKEIEDMEETDHILLNKIKMEWENGNYNYSYTLITPLIKKYNSFNIQY